MSKHPVGAKWIAENKRGRLTIWLQERNKHFEMWRWSFNYPDGSSPGGWEGGDWNTSYRACYEECSYKIQINGKVPRFRRVA